MLTVDGRVCVRGIVKFSHGHGYAARKNPKQTIKGHVAMLSVFDEVIGPALHRFKPDIIFVSAGYDAHWRDPLAGLQFRSSTYHALGTRLREAADALCSGKLVFCLEGGYDLEGLSKSVAETMRAMLGEDSIDTFDPVFLREEPMDRVRQLIIETKRIHNLLL